MAEGKNPIFLWVNEERYEMLEKAGLADKTEERLAGLKVIQVYATDEQAELLVKKLGAKHDTSTTGSIELLPPEFKNKLFQKTIDMGSNGPEVVDAVLQEEGLK